MTAAGAKIIEGLKDAVAGNFSAVTIEGQRWVRADEWHPIDAETPRENLLLYGRQINNDRSLVSFKGWIVFTGYWDDIDSAWCSMGSTWEGPFFHCTHWMPIPESPVSA